MRKPVAAMKKRVSSLINQTAEESDLKYFLYSAHDSTVSNLITWLNAYNLEWDWIDYAS